MYLVDWTDTNSTPGVIDSYVQAVSNLSKRSVRAGEVSDCLLVITKGGTHAGDDWLDLGKSQVENHHRLLITGS